MGNRRAFKTDESFLEKISGGAIGTKKALENLKKQGHFSIELERGSTSFKIWKEIKIKRVRVPDILCIKCGKRVESRAKTKMEISMSHSFSTPERGWDFGLDDDDYIALVRCTKIGDRPVDWLAHEPVQYIKLKSMKGAFKDKKVISVKPKGATEGFESRLIWPSSVASSDGIVSNINDEKLQFRRTIDHRTITLSLTKKGIKLTPLVGAGEPIKKCQIIASVVPVFDGFRCENDHKDLDYIKQLHSSSLSDRYVASKALSFFKSEDSIRGLKERLNDEKEHIYVRLEAASSLLKLGQKESLSFLEKVLDDQYLENRLECVIVLGEIKSDYSCSLLVKTLIDQNQPPEIRAGAAWSLGELMNKESLETLISVFSDEKIEVRIEAARALAKLSKEFAKEVIGFIPKTGEEERAGISWALSKSGNFKISDLLPVMVDAEARKWIAWIIGTQNEKKFINQIELLKQKDDKVYFAATVLWKILSSWVSGLEMY